MSSNRSHSDSDHSNSDEFSSPPNSMDHDTQGHGFQQNHRHNTQINYLNTFQTPEERIVHELPKKSTIPPVHYVKSLESSIVYFSVLAAACVTYWCDVRYNLIENSITLSKELFRSTVAMTEALITQAIEQKDNLTPLHLFVAVLGSSIVVTLIYKSLMSIKTKNSEKQQEEEELLAQPPDEVRALDVDEKYSFEKNKEPHSNFVNKISPAVYEWQATVGTRAELAKLTSSPAYKRHLKEKGSDPAEYNFQTKEIQAGHVEVEDYELKFCSLDLNKSLEKMDKELINEREKEDTLSRQRYSSDPSAPVVEVL